MPYSPLAVRRGAPAPDPFVARRPSVCCRGHRLAIGAASTRTPLAKCTSAMSDKSGVIDGVIRWND